MVRKTWAPGESPRELILEAAVKVFAADGYTGGSLNTVADAVGMTRQLVLHYFPSKRALLIAVLEDRDERLVSAESDALNVPIVDFIEHFDRLFPAIYDDQELMRLAHRLTAEAADQEHPAHDWLVQRQRRIRSRIEELFAAAVERGELPSTVNVRALAITTLGAAEGIEAQWLLDPELDWRQAIDGLRQLFLALASTARVT